MLPDGRWTRDLGRKRTWRVDLRSMAVYRIEDRLWSTQKASILIDDLCSNLCSMVSHEIFESRWEIIGGEHCNGRMKSLDFWLMSEHRRSTARGNA